MVHFFRWLLWRMFCQIDRERKRFTGYIYIYLSDGYPFFFPFFFCVTPSSGWLDNNPWNGSWTFGTLKKDFRIFFQLVNGMEIEWILSYFLFFTDESLRVKWMRTDENRWEQNRTGDWKANRAKWMDEKLSSWECNERCEQKCCSLWRKSMIFTAGNLEMLEGRHLKRQNKNKCSRERRPTKGGERYSIVNIVVLYICVCEFHGENPLLLFLFPGRGWQVVKRMKGEREREREREWKWRSGKVQRTEEADEELSSLSLSLEVNNRRRRRMRRGRIEWSWVRDCVRVWTELSPNDLERRG